MSPEKQSKAREEVLKIWGDENPVDPKDVRPPTHGQLDQLTYLAQIIKETLRLFPTVSMLPLRRCTRDVILNDGNLIPQGTAISVDLLGAHRNPSIWERPDEFLPERWDCDPSLLPCPIPGTSSGGYHWMAFGGGQRMCLGQQFSIIEQKILLSLLLIRYEWVVVGNANALLGRPDSKQADLLQASGIEIQLKRRGS
jgi:cytochrome P450